jgi:periplasmic divalent cation tolerance protein
MASSRASAAVVMLSTAASEEQALKIARALVGERLAACVNIIAPVRSIYRWRDAVEDDRECMLVIKTRARLTAGVERRVKQLHSYEVPEIVALPIGAGSRPYLQWLMQFTSARRVRARAAR